MLKQLYTTLFVLAPILSNSVVNLFGVKVIAGTFAMILAYGISDVVNEKEGLKSVRRLILNSAIIRFVVWGLAGTLLLLPHIQIVEGYDKMIITTFKVLLAGEISLIVSQYFIDAPLFDYMKRFSVFAVRYNLTNAITQVLSASIFAGIAFWGTGVSIASIVFGILVAKLVMQVLLTPLFIILKRNYESIAT